MMPEAGAIIAAARRVSTGEVPVETLGPLLAALDARIERLGQEASEKREQDRTWGEIVAGDEVRSEKTGTYFQVHTSARGFDGHIKVWFKGQKNPVRRPLGTPVHLRRGNDGEGADVVEILFSGLTSPEPHGFQGENAPIGQDDDDR